jgi:hypothetical protein
MVIILAIVFLKRAPPLYLKIINLYRAKRDGYYLGKTVFKKSPPIDKKISPDKRGHVKINWGVTVYLMGTQNKKIPPL